MNAGASELRVRCRPLPPSEAMRTTRWPFERVVRIRPKAALIREAVRRSIGEPEPTLDPFRDWIGGSDADSAPEVRSET